MKIVYKFNIETIKDIVLKSAKYQKVVMLIDDDSNNEWIQEIEAVFKKQVVYYSCNMDHNNNYLELLNDGTKCVITMLNECNYFKIYQHIENFVVVDVCSDEFILPHISRECDNYNLVITNKLKLSKDDVLLLLYNLIENKWTNLLTSKNYGYEEKVLYDTIYLYKTRCYNSELLVSFYQELPKEIKNRNCDFIDKILLDKDVYESDILYYKILAIKFLFISFKNNNYKMLDVYKEYAENFEMLNAVYNMYQNERSNFILKNCYESMLELITKILNFLDIVRQPSNLFKVKLSQIMSNLKLQAKYLHKDNLFKYCYLYGIFDAV